MPVEDDNPSDQRELTRPGDQHGPSTQDQTTGNMSWRQAMTTVGLALSIPWMIGVPALIGWWVDKRYATAPVWFIVGLVAGLLSTAINIGRLLRRFGQFK